MKVTIEKNGQQQAVKQKYLKNFLDRGWKTVGEKKVSKVGVAKATADIVEEEIPQPEDKGDE